MDKIITLRRQRFDLELLQQFATRLLYINQHLSIQKKILGLSWKTCCQLILVVLLYVCAGLALTPVGHVNAAETPSYTATQVDILPMGSTRTARAVNDNGDIVGTVRKEDHRGPSGVIWKNEGQTKIINNDEQVKITGSKSQGVGSSRGSLDDSQAGEDYSTVSSINNAGQIVGSMNTATGMQAFRSMPGGKHVLLEMLPGDTGSAALAINHSGKIAGWSSGSTGIRAVIWSPAGEIEALPALSSSKSCRALAINENGDVAGVCNTGSGSRAVLWSGNPDKTVLDLGTLPGDSWSEASGINSKGDVVGTSGGTGSQYHAVLWPKGDAIKDLGALTSRGSSKALAINDKGVVVGISEYISEGNVSEEEHAFVWTNQGGMQDLNDFVLSSSDFILSHAIAISSRGIITAIGRTKNVQSEGHAHGTHELPLQVFRLNPQLEGSK